MSSAVPHRTEPMGAPRPLESENITASASAVYSDALVPAAAAALKMRAPSR